MSALAALGVAPETPAFPAVVGCPLCQKNALHLFDDIVTDGIWLHCNACKAHGDIITFGAQIWNTSLPAALSKFSDLGAISSADTDRLLGEYSRGLRRQQAAEKFWAEAESQIWNHEDNNAAAKLRDLGVRAEMPETAGFVGVAHPDQIAAVCSALGRAKPATIKQNGTSLVFPYYDLPGRLSGFLLLKCRGDNRKIFIPVPGGDRKKPDAGYFLLDTALMPAPPQLKGKHFIVDDPEWALTEQLRRIRHGFQLLPISASYCGDTAISYGTPWKAFGPGTRLFQSRAATPEVISQAATAKGYVCVSKLDAASPKTARYGLVRLGTIYGAAETWQKSLHTVLAAASELTAYSFASRLTAPHEKLQNFFRQYKDDFSAEFSNRVLQTITVAPAAPTRVHRNWTLLEQNNRWYSQAGQCVCNAKIIIRHIIQSDTGEKRYVGTIYQDDWELEFNDDATKIEQMGLLDYAASVVAPHGRIIVFDRQWNKRSHMLAMQLHPPKLTVVSTKIGWDATANVFRFSNYAIDNAGEVDRVSPAVVFKDNINFPEPSPVAPINIRQFLAPGPQNAFTWNVFAAIVADLLAPTVNKDSVSTAIPPEAWDAALKIGAVLGCHHAQTSSLNRGSSAAFVRNQAAASNWPVFVSSVFDDTLLTLSVHRAHNQPLFAKTTETAATIALSYGWQTIQPKTVPLISTDFSVLKYVLPAYIQRSLRQRMTLAVKQENLTVAVLHDLHGWLSDTYGDTFHLPQALRQLRKPSDAHTALMEEISNAIQAGKIDLIPRPRRKDQPKNYLLRRKENWWINRRAVDNYMTACKNIPPNWVGVIDLLVAAGVFNGEETVQGIPGILVSTAWCDTFLNNESSSAREIG